MIKPYESTRKEAMLQFLVLKLLMLKASSYMWKSVRCFYAHIAKKVELCHLAFSDAAQIRDAATIFFKHSDLQTLTPLPPRSNTSIGGGSTSSSDANTRSSKGDSSQPKACHQWNYLGSCPSDTTSASYVTVNTPKEINTVLLNIIEAVWFYARLSLLLDPFQRIKPELACIVDSPKFQSFFS